MILSDILAKVVKLHPTRPALCMAGRSYSYAEIYARVKDMVIVGASNVYTAEVERVLADHPAIAESSIVGTPLPD